MKKIVSTTVIVLINIFVFSQCPAGQTEVTIDDGKQKITKKLIIE